MIVPSASERYEETKNQKFLLGDRIGAPSMPDYPQAMQSRHLPTQIVCVETDIDADGHVFGSRPLFGVDGCPEATQPYSDLFMGAAQTAVKQWTFMPARLCTFPPGAEIEDYCVGNDVVIEYVPVRLAFMFYFSMAEGYAHVTTQEVAENQR